MKFIVILFLMAFSSYVWAAANDIVLNQRNSTDTGSFNRFPTVPTSVNGLLGFNVSTILPEWWTLGSTLSVTGGVLDVISSGSQVNSDWNASSGVAQILNKPTNVSSFTNDANYTTTGALTTGLAGKFNNPSGSTSQYIRGDGSLATYSPGTVTSITAGTGLSGGTITSTGTISLPNTGTAGTYSGVTTDAQGRVTAGTNTSQSSATRSLNSAFQISSTRNSIVVYSVRIATTATIGGNQDGDVILEIASDSGFTTNVQTLSITQNAQAISLAVALNSVQTQTGLLSGFVPAGYYTRLRTVNNTGSPTFTYRSGQEIQL